MRNVYFSYVNVNNPTAIHPIFRDTLSNPPEGYEYVNKDFFTSTNNVANKPASPLMRGAIAVARTATKIVSMPTIWRVPPGKYDLVHANSHLAVCDKPWVFDYEAVHCLTRFHPREVQKPHVKAIVRRFLGSKKCKHLIAMSEGSRKGFVYLFPSLAHKTSVVYPAPVITTRMRDIYEQRMQRLTTRKRDDPITFMFAARYFRKKGGYEALDAFKKIHAKHANTRMLIVADIPDNLKEKEIPGVTLIDKISREEMIERHYPSADVFVYPTFYDTFGYVVLEAMAFGIPSVSTDDNVIPELIEENVDGLMVPGYTHRMMDERWIMREKYTDFEQLYRDTRLEFSSMTDNLAAAMERFVLEPELLRVMGERCFMKVDTGKFSMRVRREKLKRIYDAALA